VKLTGKTEKNRQQKRLANDGGVVRRPDDACQRHLYSTHTTAAAGAASAIGEDTLRLPCRSQAPLLGQRAMRKRSIRPSVRPSA